MTDKKRTEVNLEMCSGFFRIPTDDIIYNITVLTSNEPSTTKVVEKIIEVEKIVEVEKKTSTPAPAAPSAIEVNTPAPVSDDYYQQAARKFQQEIGLVAGEAGAGGEPDLEGIQDLAAMATDLKEVLLGMKRHPLLSGEGVSGGGGSSLTPALQQLLAKITQAQGLCEGATDVVLPDAPVAAAATKTVTRYLFNLDTVFQTIYELCTNETVKTHIKNARAKADEIFDKETFYNAISPKVSNYPEDDGLLNVPMTDVYTSLSTACNDKAIVNLLLKMDKQQADIFLDQFLLMEVPPKEEVTIAADEGVIPAGGQASPAAGGQDGLLDLLNGCQADLGALIHQASGQGGGDQSAASEELASKVDDAINIVASIQHDANRLAAGAGTNPLWLKIKSLAALAETMLSRKEEDSALAYADGLLAGQAAAQQCLAASPPKASPPPPSSSPKNEPAAKKAPAPENFGEASQDDIDRLLEELG